MENLDRKYTNRYGDVYTFTPQEDGTILWEGDFKYCRLGWPNNYIPAYDAYCKDIIEEFYSEFRMTLKEFEQAVHEYDSEKNQYKYPYLDKYRKLIYSDTTKLDMVDPSGGPYIAVGMEWMGGIVTEIKDMGQGFALTIEKEK